MHSLLQATLSGLLIFSLCGCGGSGEAVPDMYHLSGKVTFNGAPVEHGSINFNPTVEKGGHAGFAVITNGTYDTKAEGGKGHAGGSLMVIIKSSGPPKPNDEASPGPFPEWSTTVDFPKADGTKDFEVPKEAANPKPVAPARNDV